MQRISDHLFAHMDSVCVYIDDILVATENFEEHFSSLEKVSQEMWEAFLIVFVTKAYFYKFSLDYVGLYISRDGIRSEDTHKNQMIQFKAPLDTKTLRSFLAR